MRVVLWIALLGCTAPPGPTLPPPAPARSEPALPLAEADEMPVPVAHEPVTPSLRSTGTLMPLSVVNITSPASGLIVKLLADASDTVHKGQLLAVLERKVTIVSPIDGVVLERRAEVGMAVAGPAVLFVLASKLDKLLIQVPIDEHDVNRIRPGMTAALRVDAFPAKLFAGIVQRIGMAPLAGSPVTYPVTILVDNADLALRPGMTTLATFDLGAP